MQLQGHARSKGRSAGPEYVAGLAILAAAVGVVMSVATAAGYVQAAAPRLPRNSIEYRVPSTEYPEPPGTRYSILDTQIGSIDAGVDFTMRIAVPFPHPTPTFTPTPTSTPPGCGLLWRPFASPSTASDALNGVSA